MDAFQWSCDALNTAVGYMQTIRVADIRQTLDFLGVHHTEVIVGLCMFILMQFTKFTGVLLIAIAIAFAIFYMWDTYFPELNQRRSIDRDITPMRPFMEFARPEYQDARTSARLPPFANTSSNNSDQEFFAGDQIPSKNNPPYSTFSSGRNTPLSSQNMTPIVRSNMATTQTGSRGTEISGLSTPVGQLGSMGSQPRRSKTGGGSNQRQQGNRNDDRLAYRSQNNTEYDYNPRRGSTAISSEYRSSRSRGQSQAHRQAPMYQDGNRSRRHTGSSMHDEGRPTRNRRNSRDRSSNIRKQIANEFNDHTKAYERRAYNTPAGPATNLIHYVGTHNVRSAQYSHSSNRNSERDTHNYRNPRTPNYSGNSTPNRIRPNLRSPNL